MLSVKNLFRLLGIVIILVALFLPGYTKVQELKDRNRDLEVKLAKLRVDNSLLQEEIRRVQQDPVYQEEIVRSKLGVVRKGEVLFKIDKSE